jgi:hypothetical protein
VLKLQMCLPARKMEGLGAIEQQAGSSEQLFCLLLLTHGLEQHAAPDMQRTIVGIQPLSLFEFGQRSWQVSLMCKALAVELQLRDQYHLWIWRPELLVC